MTGSYFIMMHFQSLYFLFHNITTSSSGLEILQISCWKDSESQVAYLRCCLTCWDPPIETFPLQMFVFLLKFQHLHSLVSSANWYLQDVHCLSFILRFHPNLTSRFCNPAPSNMLVPPSTALTLPSSLTYTGSHFPPCSDLKPLSLSSHLLVP